MKKLLLSTTILLTTSWSAAASEQADNKLLPGEFSGSVSFVSDYSFRGITQTGEGGAIQGGFDYNHDSGFYLGVWGSNVDFGANDDADIEVDYYTGYTLELGDLDLNLGAIYYTYPGVSSNLNYDFYEIQGVTSYDFDSASIAGSINYSPEYFGKTGDATYLKAQIDIPLLSNFGLIDSPITKMLEVIESPIKNYALLTKSYGYISNNVSLNAHIGRQLVQNNIGFGYPDYNDWGVGVQFNIEGFDMALQYSDTNIKKNNCADGCDSKVIFSISRSF